MYYENFFNPERKILILFFFHTLNKNKKEKVLPKYIKNEVYDQNFFVGKYLIKMKKLCNNDEKKSEKLSIKKV